MSQHDRCLKNGHCQLRMGHTGECESDTLRTDEFVLSYEYAEIPFEDWVEQLRKFERERNALQSWKDQMMHVESEWDQQKLAKMLGGKIGQSCRRTIMEKVPEMIKLLEESATIGIGGDWRARRDKLINR